MRTVRTAFFALLSAAFLILPAAAVASHDDEPARLRVYVLADGGDGAFAFSASGARLPEAFAVTTENGTGEASFDDLDAGDARVRPVPPSGWRLTNASCDLGSPRDLQLESGETTTCTFGFARAARLVVRVEATGGEGAFEFDAEGDAGVPESFRMRTTGGAGERAFDVAPNASLALSSDLPSGWRLVEAACTGERDPANFTVPPGTQVVCTFSVSRLASLSGLVWRDADADGRRDANETGLAGVVVYLDANEDARRDANEANATTDANGTYVFEALEPGRHVVRLSLDDGWNATAPDSGRRVERLSAGERETGVDFGVSGPATGSPSKRDDEEGKPAERHGHRGHGPGWGVWKHAAKHGKRAHDDLEAWLDDIGMPTGYSEDARGLQQLIDDATKGCHRTNGWTKCLWLKAEARRVVTALWAKSLG